MPGLKSFCGIILLLTLLSCQPLRAQTFTDASQLLHPMAPIEGGFQKGASAADFNNDGLVDIYHPNGDQVGRLYLNRGEAGFFDILPEIGLVEGARLWGAAFGDFDNDAYLDIVFEDFSAPSRLYKNNRNWSFTQVNDRANVSIPSLAQGAGWGDFNLDGKLDLMVVNDAGANQLFNNLTFATFAEVTQSANVQTFGNSYGMSWGDLNNDGYPDVFVTTCHRTDPLRSIKHLLLNNGDETFTDINYSAGVADSLASWGVVWFDYDNDNDLDLYIGNSVHAPRPGFNRLYRNNGDNTFANVSFAAGVAGESDENSFGIAAADFDNDGWIDLYVTNRYRQHRLYHNNGDGTFTDIAQGAGIVEDAHKAVAVADFNNDGWIDIFTTGYPHNRLMLNDGGSNHWIAIKARGTASNYYGVGTRIEVYTDSLRQIREIRAGDSFCSQNDNLTAHFGLGGYTQIDSIVLRWPGGGVDRIRSLQEVDQTLTIVEGSGISDPPSTFALQSPTDGITLSQSADDIQFIWHNAFTLYIDAVSYTLYLKGEDLWTRATFDTSFSNIYDNYFVVGRDVFKDNHVYSWTVDVTDGFSVTASTDLWRFVVNPYGTLFTSMTSGAVVLEASQSSGTSWADYDSDGDEDLFVANSGNQKNFLFRNDGHGAFTKITEGAIVNDEASSMGCSWGDYNQDGYLDLFVANASNQNNDLYRNNGDGTFTKVTDDIMVSDGGNSIGCSWGDTDNDGYLDLFVTNTSNQKNGLYHNNGDGTFTKITAGEIVNEAFNSMGCAWGDYDADGDLDLFVANASNQYNALYTNLGNGSFAKMTAGAIANDESNSRGGSWGDFDNDDDLDLYVANFGDNALYANNGDGSFTKITAGALVQDNSDSRSSTWSDFDADGDLDLYVTNAGDNLLFLNNGDKTFTQVISGDFVNDGSVSAGASSGDFDADGDLDLFVANLSSDEKNLLFANNGQSNHWLAVKCVGTRANTSAIGTKVSVKSKLKGTAVWQMREISGQSGFAAQNSLVAAFGLADAAEVDSVRIAWPLGTVQYLPAVAADQFLVITEDSTFTGIAGQTGIAPRDFQLAQNYPNPFNPSTTIHYQLATPGEVELAVYNLLGESVRILVREKQSRGAYSVRWDGKNQLGVQVPSGLYVYRFKTEKFTQARKMLLLR